MMSGQMVLSGRLWVLCDNEGLISDIDTDMIYHNAHLAVTDIEKMGQFALGNLEGYEGFADEARNGDLILAGENFGSGSSRQHAVDCFKALGIGAVIARSFGAIYKRNAINSGFPIVEIPGIPKGLFQHHATVQLELEKGRLSSGEVSITGNPMSTVARDIYLAGGLFQYAERMENRIQGG
jgi:3-isopropylmalate/(R)-2-methylmalate dehydratase small subunit